MSARRLRRERGAVAVVVALSATMSPGIAANPYLRFYTRAVDSGELDFRSGVVPNRRNAIRAFGPFSHP